MIATTIIIQYTTRVLALNRHQFYTTLSNDVPVCIARIGNCELNDHQLGIVNNCSLLRTAWFHKEVNMPDYV